MSLPDRVLVIDDEVRLRQTLVRILKQAGCETTMAEDGQIALRLLDECMFDLVLLDIRLPDMGGLEILERIRQRDASLPVVLLTGHGSMQSAVEALRLGATDYLLKPVDPEVLVARIRTILKERAVERRRRELRDQIVSLQAELRALDKEDPAHPVPPSLSPRPQDRFLKCGQLILDLQARSATLGNKVLLMPPAAFDYLIVLAKNSPEVVDYRSLVLQAQDYQVESSQARELAKWHIHVLRQAIEAEPKNPQHILNVRGIGYRLLIG